MGTAKTASKADLRVAAVALAWAVIGAAATRAPWHSISVLGSELDVRGGDLVPGQVAIVAFALTAFLAGFTLLAAGPLLGRAIGVCGLVAVGALGKYAWDIRAARDAIVESGGRGLGGGAGLRAGAIVAGIAAVAIVAAAVVGVIASRNRGVASSRTAS